MGNKQILYPKSVDHEIHEIFREEAVSLSSFGFQVGTEIIKDIKTILYRGFMIKTSERYPNNPRMIQNWEANHKTLFMSEYYPIIKDLTIPTEFIESLNERQVMDISQKNNWPKLFIKSDSKSLFGISDTASLWPESSIQQMKVEYSRRRLNGPFAIRKYIDDPEIFYNEQRYWVLNGRTYHPSGIIPDFVAEAGRRMYAFSGSHYFTIDVAGDYIVEVNPGESSDRGGDNSLDFFCEIFAKEFLK